MEVKLVGKSNRLLRLLRKQRTSMVTASSTSRPNITIITANDLQFHVQLLAACRYNRNNFMFSSEDTCRYFRMVLPNLVASSCSLCIEDGGRRLSSLVL